MWITKRKALNPFVQITSKNLASGIHYNYLCYIRRLRYAPGRGEGGVTASRALQYFNNFFFNLIIRCLCNSSILFLYVCLPHHQARGQKIYCMKSQVSNSRQRLQKIFSFYRDKLKTLLFPVTPFAYSVQFAHSGNITKRHLGHY